MNFIEEELKRVERNPLPKRSDEEINILANDLLKRMTLKEKIGQLVQSGHDSSAVTGPAFDASKTVENIVNGMVGSIIGTEDDRISFHLQKKAVEESRLGIPLFFCADIIHGCRTTFPVNLAMSGSFDPELIEEVCKVSAYESSHSGVDLNFSPMVDLVRDPRWGRVMESNGEDPYLSSVLAKAYVNGYQQDDLASYDSVACCLKHYIGYGASEGGRDYNSVDISNHRLHTTYLPPFKAGIDAGASMVMSSFNVLNDIPVTGNKYLLRDILRDELDFKGVVISDYTSSGEMLNHRAAHNERDVAKKCIIAGLDHEMISPTYAKYLEDLVLSGEVEESLVDEACLRMLVLKYKMGLFDNPYKHLYINSEDYFMTDKALDVALKMSHESIVMLENNGVLPLNKNKSIALIGPFGNTQELVGPWGGKCDRSKCNTLYNVLKENVKDVKYALGTTILGDDKSGFEEALDVAKTQDVIIYACGENEWQSGEGSSRANLNLPGVQDELLDELKQLGKPIVMLVFAGRPLIMKKYKGSMDAILYCWFLGTKSSEAIYNTLYGINNPSAKLTMSFPYCEGQIPVYYNALSTGRPFIPNEKYCSHYMDIPNEPLYTFGDGLSYTSFTYSDFNVEEIENGFKLVVKVTNSGQYAGDEIVMAFIKAHSSNIARPERELKGFKRVHLAVGETKNVSIILDYDAFKYYYLNDYILEKNVKYDLMIGGNLKTLLKELITIK